MMNKFVFITVNYNGSDFTKKYLESINDLILNDNDIVEIVVVDNCSDLSEYAKLSGYCDKYHKKLNVIRLVENVGYFKGLNQGLARVQNTDDSVIIVGNNDLTFNADFISNLKKIDFDDDVLVIAPNIITKDGRKQNPHVVKAVPRIEKIKAKIYFSNYFVGQFFRLINQSIKTFLPRKTKSYDYGKMKIKRGIGACYVLTKNFFKYFDRLDDRVFLWGEEALLSNQLEEVNGTTLYDPTIKIIHHENAAVKFVNSRARYNITKNSYKIYCKYL